MIVILPLCGTPCARDGPVGTNFSPLATITRLPSRRPAWDNTEYIRLYPKKTAPKPPSNDVLRGPFPIYRTAPRANSSPKYICTDTIYLSHFIDIIRQIVDRQKMVLESTGQYFEIFIHTRHNRESQSNVPIPSRTFGIIPD